MWVPLPVTTEVLCIRLFLSAPVDQVIREHDKKMSGIRATMVAYILAMSRRYELSHLTQITISGHSTDHDRTTVPDPPPNMV